MHSKKETVSLDLTTLTPELRTKLNLTLPEDNKPEEKSPDDMTSEEFTKYVQKMQNDPIRQERDRREFIMSLIKYDTTGYIQYSKLLKCTKDETICKLTIPEACELMNRCLLTSRFDILFGLANEFYCGKKCMTLYPNSSVKCTSLKCQIYTGMFSKIINNTVHYDFENDIEPEDEVFALGFRTLYRYFEYEFPEDAVRKTHVHGPSLEVLQEMSEPDFETYVKQKFKNYRLNSKLIRTIRQGTNSNMKLLKVLIKRGFIEKAV